MLGRKPQKFLLGEYDTLDNIYKHLDELKPGVVNKLVKDRENAYLSQKLAEIVTDLQIPLDLEIARPSHYDPEKVRALFRELEFRTLIETA